MLSINNIFGLVLLVVPEYSDRLSPVHDELVSSTTARVRHERSEVFLLHELIDFRSGIVFVDATLSSIAVNVGQFIDTQRVFLVERY